MSTTVDNRVVQMQFNNQDFEKNVSTTISSLDKLKQKLNFSGATKGLEEVQAVADRTNFKNLEINATQAGFHFQDVWEKTTRWFESNIAARLGNAISSTARMFTVDPIKQGLQEYETQINAIQTIMANTSAKGTTLEQVNAALDELNEYADKTIYNFTEMTRNIGTFTAAGLDLKTSTSAIQGIANLAAVSGSTAQQASTAMYQLSQALASGTVKLMDWNSVVNAGMGGQVFQDALKKTASSMNDVAEKVRKMSESEKKAFQEAKGYTDDQMQRIEEYDYDVEDLIKKNGSFRESLQEGWITAEVLSETLSKMTQTGAAEYLSELTGVTMEEIEAAQKLVDQNKDGLATYDELAEKMAESKKITKEEAIEILKMADTATNAATKVKTFTQLVDTLKETAQSGWTQTWETLVGDFEEAKSLWTEVSNVLGDIINNSSKARNDLLQGWKDLGGRQHILDGIANAFNSLMNIIKPIGEAFREVFPPTTAEQLYNFTEKFKEVTEVFRAFTERIAPSIKSAFKGIFNVVKLVGTIVSKVFSTLFGFTGDLGGVFEWLIGILGKLGEGLTNISEFALKAVEKVSVFLSKAKKKIKEFFGFKIDTSGWDSFLEVINNIWNLVKKLGNAIGKIVISVGKAFGEVLNGGGLNNIMDAFNDGVLGMILLNINKITKGLSGKFDDLKAPLSGIKDILDGVKSSLESWQESLQAKTLKTIAEAIAILAASILVLSLIDPARITSSLGAITTLFIELAGFMAVFAKISASVLDPKSLSNMTKMAGTTVLIGAALLLLSAACAKMAKLSWDELAVGLTGVLGLMAIVIGASIALSTVNGKIVTGALQLVIMASAMLIFAEASAKFASMSWEGIAKAGVAIAGILIIAAGFGMLDRFTNKMISASFALAIIGAAMEIFANVAKKFESMSWEGIAKASVAIAGILVLAAGFGMLDRFTSKMISGSIALVIIGAAMEIFADISKKFESMSWEGIAKAGTGIAGILVLAAGFGALAKFTSGLTTASIALVIIGAAMEIFADVASKLGSMDWEALGKAGAAIGGILVLATGFALLSQFASGMIGSAAAILVIAAAMAIFTPTIERLGELSLESIIKSLVTMAAVFVILGVAGYTLAGAVPGILGLAGALSLISIAVALAGAGIFLLGIGITTLAAALTAGATAIVAGLTIIITGIIGLVPAIASAIGNGIIVILQTLTGSIEAIGEFIKALVLTAIDILVSCIPQLADGLLKLITGVLEAATNYVPQIVSLLLDLIINIIQVLGEKIPDLVTSIVELFTNLFTAVFDALGGLDTTTLLETIAGIGLVSGLIVLLSALTPLIPGAMVGVLGVGGIIAELAIVLAAIGALSKIPGLEDLIGSGGNLLEKIGTAIGQFVGGIAGGIAQGFTSSLPEIGSDLSGFMSNLRPFIDGIKLIDDSVLKSATTLVGVILALTAASVIDSIASWLTGSSGIDEFGEKLVPFGEAMVAFSKTVSGKIDDGSVAAAANAGKTLSEMASNLPNSGGLAGWFAGENDMSAFGDQLVPFGEAMVAFSQTVSGKIDAGAITAAANAGKTMSEMAATLPNSGGVAAWFAGENDMKDFANQLVPFGKALCDFSTTVSGNGIKAEAITAASNAGKTMIELANTLPYAGGVVSWFKGDNSLSGFGEQIKMFGQAIVDFSNIITSSGGIDQGAIKAASTAGGVMIALQDSLPNGTKGIKSWWSGDEDLGDFAKNLKKFGEAIVDFSKTITKSTSKANVDSAVAACNAVSNLAVNLNSSSGLSEFGDALKKFGKTGMTNFVEGFKGQEKNISDTINGLFTNALKEVKDSAEDFKAAGIDLIKNIINGIDSPDYSIVNKIKELIVNSVDKIRGYHDSYKAAGVYLVQGFSDGIDVTTYEAEAKSKAMAQAALNAARSVLMVHSPSKAFYQIGSYGGQGFINALRDYESEAYDSSSGMAKSAINGLKSAISNISTMIDGDLDVTPVIRPVIDLDGIEDGIGFINGMFSNETMTLSTVGSISSLMSRNQNGIEDDILSAIKDVGKKLTDNTGNVYNVNGITYDDGSNVSSAVEALIRAARIERRA